MTLKDSRSAGLSPLARGTLELVLDDTDGERFIPAGAGNTPSLDNQSQVIPVYPRWRGEHTENKIPASIITGLSPLARGTRDQSAPPTQLTRFIPAGAGNTLRSPFS